MMLDNLNNSKYPFTLSELPYSKTAFSEWMSAETFDFHHGKHHAAYVNNLNQLLEAGKQDLGTLQEIILASSKDSTKTPIFNNAAQIWNHSFFWMCLSPNSKQDQNSSVIQQIIKDFGSYEKFAEEFIAKGLKQFGSGWVWLVFDKERNSLKIMTTSNADLPMVHGMSAILTCDVWEHSYYIDYRNDRKKYLTTFLERMINWQFVQNMFDECAIAK